MVTLLSRNWWALVVRGVLALAFGILAWTRPDIFWASLVLVFAAYAIVDGVFAIASVFSDEDGPRWPHLIEGLVGLGVGALIVLFPDRVGIGIVLLIGIWAVVTGLLEIASAIRLRQQIKDEWLLGVGGMLSVLLGLIMIANPRFGQVTTTYILGTYGILFGFLLVLLGLRLRTLSEVSP